jgi:hypothetical protein
MKKTLKEDLERIHGLTYGKKVLNESFIDNILNKVGLSGKDDIKKVDDPKKADLVTTDVQQFFDNIKNAADGGGLSQQGQGSMTYQKEVESMQIGLMMLGYELPKHGVDGLFGPETASAVEKFKSDNNIKDNVNESAEAIRQIAIGQYGWKEKSGQLSGGGEISSDLSKIVNELIAEFNEKYPECVGTFTSGNDQFHQNITSYTSLHTKGLAVDLTLPSSCHSSFIELLKQYKSKYNGFSFIDEYTNPTKLATGGHFHVSYRKGKPEGGGKSSGGSGSVSVRNIKATPEMLTKLLELLKQKGVTSEDLKKYIDSITTGGGAAFSDLDLTTDEGFKTYAEICQKFINNRQPNLLGITGEMMAKGAREAFDKYKRFVPAELALAQLAAEGGIGNKDPNSRPIRTKNPFNVGNTDSGANIEHGQVQSGINAYYNLIARNYLGKGKTASDLIQNFVNHSGNRYASATGYESSLNKLAGEANRVAKTVLPSTTSTGDTGMV